MELTFLGPFEVIGADGPVALGATKERTLLALLALRANEVVSTAQLIDGLWGEDPPPTAVKTVHGHVARVRRRLEAAGLGDALVTREPGYFLVVEPDRIDAVRFEDHSRAGHRALTAGDAVAAEEQLATGLGLWRGEAFADCRRDSDAIEAAAVRLDELRLGTLEDHVDAQLELGQHAAMAGDLEALVVRYPMRERLWGALMLALYRSQRQVDALRAYQRARDSLIDNLGVEPSAQLRRLETRILDGDESLDLVVPAATVVTTSPASARLVALSSSGPALVGRDEELAALVGLWARARDGDRQVAMISGEPGIGKTRLAAEVAVLAQDAGARVLHGRCDEGLGVPYQPFVEALRGYVEVSTDGELIDGLGRFSGELVRLMPELAARAPDLPPPLQSDPATEQYRLFEAVVSWLRTLASSGPLVLVLDDLHWAAPPTVLLLRHVMRSEEAGCLLLLATYRHTELERGHPLAEMLADAHVSAPAPEMERFELTGLDESAVAAFVETATGSDLGDAGQRFAQRVYLETAGNPFFVSEIVRSLRESGDLDPGATDESPEGILWPDDMTIPSAAREVVLRRVARLPDDAQRLLTSAAVVGPEFEVEVLEGLADFGADAVLVALEDAARARLIDEAGPNRFSFSHAIVRGALYDGLSASRRVRMHGLVGEAIEDVHRSDLRQHWGELAFHYSDANPAKAVRYATDAARDALARLAFEDAVNLCQRGLAAVERARLTRTPVAEADECDLLIVLGRAELRSGQPRGRASLLRAYDVAVSLGDEQRQAEALLAVNRGFFSRIGRTDEDLVAALEHAIEAQPPGDTSELAELLATLASELVWAADGERRFELSDRALASARRVGDPRTLAQVLLLRSMTLPAPDTLDERLAVCGELLALANAIGDPGIRFDCAFSHGGTAWEAGDVATINHMEEIATALAAELGQPRLQWQASFMRTSRRLLEGALDEAEQMATATLELGQRAGLDAEASIFYNEQILEIRRWQGRLAELIAPFRDLAGNESFDFGYSLTRYVFDGGETEAARSAYHGIMARGTFPPRRDMLAITTMYNVAYLASRFDDPDGARLIYDALLPYAAMYTSTTVAKPVGEHFLALLARTFGDLDLADAHFERATRAHEGVGAPLLLAETQLEHARMLMARDGGSERSELLVDAVRAAAVPLGAGFLVRGCAEIDDGAAR